MPLFYTNQLPVIGVWKITETWPDMLDMFQDKTLYIDDVSKIQSDKRKCEWLATRLLLKRLSGTEMSVSYKDNGSPFLMNCCNYMSVSHTKGYAALILSKHPDPGIDIEYRSERAWKLRAKFLSTEEQQLINPLPCYSDPFTQFSILPENPRPDVDPETFSTICWCAKETAFKALQENEVDFIHHFHITSFTFADGGIILKETKTPKQTIFYIRYQVTDDYVLTWKE